MNKIKRILSNLCIFIAGGIGMVGVYHEYNVPTIGAAIFVLLVGLALND